MKNEKKIAVLQLRCTKDDRTRFHSLAKNHNLTLSKLIIKLLNDEIEKGLILDKSKLIS